MPLTSVHHHCQCPLLLSLPYNDPPTAISLFWPLYRSPVALASLHDSFPVALLLSSTSTSAPYTLLTLSPQQVALISLRGSLFQSSHPHQPWHPALSSPSVSVFSRRPMFGGSSRKVAGLSKAVTTHGFKCSIRTSGVLTAGKQGQRKEETDAKRRLHIQDMSNDDRDIVESMFSPFALLSLGLSLGGYCPFTLPAIST
ncbi:uncharacterized protein F5147DRAFT_773251 [Suillus discolor]|uniref:Uncharacterized protein n=1 Tax=Suillus discolor TaxID=1912936 RepID=A0A9P7JUQ5_9AGAM|nr:uncharacterized protein F5147DRAFT_773251 [Suillus discolor]KAG2108915.1 hypothetical protein F5147DRAFT_773251 [Suillus discolor]